MRDYGFRVTGTAQRHRQCIRTANTSLDRWVLVSDRHSRVFSSPAPDIFKDVCAKSILLVSLVSNRVERLHPNQQDRQQSPKKPQTEKIFEAIFGQQVATNPELKCIGFLTLGSLCISSMGMVVAGPATHDELQGELRLLLCKHQSFCQTSMYAMNACNLLALLIINF